MTDQKFFVKTLESEIPIFNRVFLALPDKPVDWRAHPKNKSTLQLAKDMTAEALVFPTLLKTGKIDFSKASPPKGETMSKIAFEFKDSMEEVHKIASKMTEKDWSSPAVLLIGDKNEWKSTKGEMALNFLIDMIHHRGQLTTHIRPQGGKVPSIYGPSGDSVMEDM
jgi:uncharacterized damage-inducible protein DinB